MQVHRVNSVLLYRRALTVTHAGRPRTIHVFVYTLIKDVAADRGLCPGLLPCIANDEVRPAESRCQRQYTIGLISGAAESNLEPQMHTDAPR